MLSSPVSYLPLPTHPTPPHPINVSSPHTYTLDIRSDQRRVPHHVLPSRNHKPPVFLDNKRRRSNGRTPFVQRNKPPPGAFRGGAARQGAKPPSTDPPSAIPHRQSHPLIIFPLDPPPEGLDHAAQSPVGLAQIGRSGPVGPNRLPLRVGHDTRPEQHVADVSDLKGGRRLAIGAAAEELFGEERLVPWPESIPGLCSGVFPEPIRGSRSDKFRGRLILFCVSHVG